MTTTCTFCSAAATHVLRPNQARRTWEACPMPPPQARYCASCAGALEAGMTPDELARALNARHAARRDGSEPTP